MSNVALSIGGSMWQVDVIRKAKQMGLRTLVADISGDAPGQPFADLFLQVDTNDKDKLLALAREHRVSVVLAEQSDRVVPVAGYLNQKLGLHGITEAVARRFTDKLAMRNALRESGIPMPRYAEVRNVTEAEKAVRNWGYPSILKPKKSQSSLGVFRVENTHDLRRYFGRTQEHSRDNAILVEEFIDGTEITVEGFNLAGQFYTLAVSEKEHYSFNSCVARRLSYPPRFDDRTMTRIRQTADQVVTTLGLRDGLSHAEYRLRRGVPYLIEVAARGGGNRIASAIVPHVSGIDVYQLLIERLQGAAVAMPARLGRAAVLYFFDFPEGRVKAVHGLQDVERERLVDQFVLNLRPGDLIRRAADDRSRPGYALVLGDSRTEVDARVDRLEELITVEYEREIDKDAAIPEINRQRSRDLGPMNAVR